jgi:hypothetical protein
LWLSGMWTDKGGPGPVNGGVSVDDTKPGPNPNGKNPADNGVDTGRDTGVFCPKKPDCVHEPYGGPSNPPTRAGSSNDDCQHGDNFSNCKAPDGTYYNRKGKKICGTGPPAPPPPPVETAA